MEREFVIVFDRGLYSVMWRYITEPTNAARLLIQAPDADNSNSSETQDLRK